MRAERQELLFSSGLAAAWFVLDEGVLRRPYGGRAAMCDQLMHLETVAEYPNVFIQIMPFRAVSHPGGEGPIRVIEYRDKPSIW